MGNASFESFCECDGPHFFQENCCLEERIIYKDHQFPEGINAASVNPSQRLLIDIPTMTNPINKNDSNILIEFVDYTIIAHSQRKKTLDFPLMVLAGYW
jgi:hypothetical protein